MRSKDVPKRFKGSKGLKRVQRILEGSRESNESYGVLSWSKGVLRDPKVQSGSMGINEIQ